MSRITRIIAPLLVALLLGGGAADGQSPFIGPGGLPFDGPGALAPTAVFITMNPAFDIEDVTPAEILGGSPAANDFGSTSLAAGPGLTAVAADPSPGMTPDTNVVRFSDHVFRAWLQNADPQLRDIQVEYAFVSDSGVADRLAHWADPTSYLAASALVIGPVRIFRFGNWQLIQGGGRFDLGLDAAHLAGPHSGTLIVVINSI